eukprot:2819551-Pleurochrysis_carterae.AAC.1
MQDANHDAGVQGSMREYRVSLKRLRQLSMSAPVRPASTLWQSCNVFGIGVGQPAIATVSRRPELERVIRERVAAIYTESAPTSISCAVRVQGKAATSILRTSSPTSTTSAGVPPAAPANRRGGARPTRIMRLK